MTKSAYERYCEIRDRFNYKDADVAKGANVTKSTFSDWKAGRYTPKQEKLNKIAAFLGVSSEYIMTGKEDSEQSTQQPQSDDIKVEFDRFRGMLERGEIKPLCYDNTPAGPKEIKALLKMLDASEEMIRDMLNSKDK